MPNQYKNKVIFGDQTLIDLTSDTVTAADMLAGITAHDGSGAPITGTIIAKTSSDVSLVNTTMTIPAGCYGSTINYDIPGVEVPIPESGTNSFYVTLPNGENDTVTLIFEVDDEGNSDITKDENDGGEVVELTAAEGVSF